MAIVESDFRISQDHLKIASHPWFYNKQFYDRDTPRSPLQYISQYKFATNLRTLIPNAWPFGRLSNPFYTRWKLPHSHIFDLVGHLPSENHDDDDQALHWMLSITMIIMIMIMIMELPSISMARSLNANSLTGSDPGWREHQPVAHTSSINIGNGGDDEDEEGRGVEDKMGCDQTETLDGAFVPHCPFSHQRLQCLPPGRIISDSTKSNAVCKNNTKTAGEYHIWLYKIQCSLNEQYQNNRAISYLTVQNSMGSVRTITK